MRFAVSAAFLRQFEAASGCQKLKMGEKAGILPVKWERQRIIVAKKDCEWYIWLKYNEDTEWKGFLWTKSISCLIWTAR